MSEENTGQQAENNGQQTSQAEKFEPITSQEQLTKLIGERINKVKSQFADYDELKTKAGQLEAFLETGQTDAEKATKRATKAETERDEARAEALRLRMAVEHGISLEDADLFLTGKDEDSLRAQAQRLSDRVADRKKQGNHVPREGANTQPAADNVREFARTLFGSQ